MVELQPLRHSSNETLVSVGHLCEYCQGNGWFWGADERGMGVKETCPRCNGNGEVDAIIKIAWQPGAPDKPCGEDARMLTQNCR